MSAPWEVREKRALETDRFRGLAQDELPLPLPIAPLVASLVVTHRVQENENSLRKKL